MRRKARIDATATALVQAIRKLGGQWLPLPGAAIDGIVLMRERVILVDFKATAKSRKTKTQQRLIAAGFPIQFWSTSSDVINGLGFHHD